MAAVALRSAPDGWPAVLDEVAVALQVSTEAGRAAFLTFLTVLPEEFASPRLPSAVRYAS